MSVVLVVLNQAELVASRLAVLVEQK